MAKRGRPPKDETERKSEPISIRLTREVRDKIDEARKSDSADRTLSQEIERRIEESFGIEQTILEAFGGDARYWLMRILVERIGIIEQMTGRSFFDDRFTFDHVRECIDTILDHFRPPRISLAPKRLRDDPYLNAMAKKLGRQEALVAIAGLELADSREVNPRDPVLFPGPVPAGAAAPHLVQKLTKSGVKQVNKTWPRDRQRFLKAFSKFQQEDEK